MTDQAINYWKKNATWHKIIDAGIAVKIKTKRKKDDSCIENLINQKGAYICSSAL